MKKATYIILAVIILLMAGAVALYQKKANNKQPSAEVTVPPVGEPVNSGAQTGENEESVIIKTDSGFSPSSITIKKGETVTWQNQSAQPFWPASARHPTHTAYSGTALSEHCPDTAQTAFDACQDLATGGSWSFTFDKIGSWKYHDHLNPSHFGAVIVE